MNRILFPVLFGLVLTLSGAQAADRPNIIFLLTDDQRDNTFGGMGHPFVKTPHVDELLKKSVRFRNTYVAEPVCSPSRVSYLNGMHERVHGIGFTSSYELTEDQWKQTYPYLLREAGYYTGFVGKFGLEYYTFRGTAEEKFDYWWGHDGWTKFFPKDFHAESTLPYHRAAEEIITSIMGEAISEFLGTVPSDRPFCLSVSFNVPHGSQTTSMYPDIPGWREMAAPANENPKLKGHRFFDGLYRDFEIEIPADTATDPYCFIPEFIHRQDRGRANSVYPYNYTIATNREHHVRYYQTITALDHEIGEMLEELKAKGLDQNTVILFGSDHGLLMGEYGMGGKALLYDLASKIPCFIHDPSAPDEARGITREELISSLDIPVTILDYAGVEAPNTMYGSSLKPLVEGKKIPWREELFLESLYSGRDTPFQEGIRTGRWKYIRMFDAPGEILNTTATGGYLEEDIDFSERQPEFEMLFDLEADPGERNNLIEAYEKETLLKELREKTAAGSEHLRTLRERYRAETEVKSRNR